MDIKEAIATALKEIIFPELQELRRDMAELKAGQAAITARLNDHNAHLVDLSRRLDQMRRELTVEIHQVRTELMAEIHQVRGELIGRIDRVISDLMETNRNIAHLYEVIVRRDDYQQLQERVARIEHEVSELREKVAA